MLTAVVHQEIDHQSATFKAVNPQEYVSPLSPFVQYLQDALSDLWTSLEAGDLTPDAWYAAMLDELSTSYTAAYMAGANTAALTAADLANIAYYVGNQATFLDNFRFEIQSAAEFLKGWKSRAVSYAAGISAPYWKGETRILPLPAMPGDGTSICRSNDLCEWRIEVLDEQAGDYDAFWVLERSADGRHCQTCLERASLWNPLRIRGGRLDLVYISPLTMEGKELRTVLKHLVGQHDQHLHGLRGTPTQPKTVVVPEFSEYGESIRKVDNMLERGNYIISPDNTIYEVYPGHASAFDAIYKANSIPYRYGAMAEGSINHALNRLGFMRAYRFGSQLGLQAGKFDKGTFQRIQDLVPKMGLKELPLYIDTTDSSQGSIYAVAEDLLGGHGFGKNWEGNWAIKERRALKHLAGQHNQKRHGWRYGSAAPTTYGRLTSSVSEPGGRAELDVYNKRAATNLAKRRAATLAREAAAREAAASAAAAAAAAPTPPPTPAPEPIWPPYMTERPWGADIDIPYRPNYRTEESILAVHRQWLAQKGYTNPTEQDAIMKQLDDEFQTLCDSHPLCVRAPADAVDSIILEGRWKTQFESGSSRGDYDPHGRSEAEAAGLGTPYDLPNNKRPVYGYLHGAEDSPFGPSYYGEVILTPKRSVRDRTTVVSGDSLGNFYEKDVVGTPLNHTNLTSIPKGWYEYSNVFESTKFDTPNKPFGVNRHVSYFEAQIHGGLKLADIEYATFTEDCYDFDVGVAPKLKPQYQTQADALTAQGIKLISEYDLRTVTTKEFDYAQHISQGTASIVLKHMAGMHNQKRHGWRYGGGEAGSRTSRLGAARTSLHRTPEQAERSEYRKRASLPTPTKRTPDLATYTKPATPAPAPKPKRVRPPRPKLPKPPKPVSYVELDPDDASASHRDFHRDPTWKAWQRDLTSSERNAIANWVGSPGVHGVYKELNSALRSGTFDAAGHPHSAITKVYKGMNSAIEKGRLHKDMVLWRSMDFAPMHSGAGTRFKAGDIIPDKAFVATAPKKGTATGWYFMSGPSPVIWRIKAPKGSKGAYLSWEELSNPYMHETEFVLPRNSRFKIDSVDFQYVNGKRTAVYDMTLLNEPGATKESHAPWSTTSTKHFAGQHNQKRHGWRYTGSGVARALRLPYDDPERAEYAHRMSARTAPPPAPITPTDPTLPTSSRPWGADIPLKYRPDAGAEATILARHRRFLNEQGLGAISGGIDRTMKELTDEFQTICDENPLCVRAPAAAVDRIIEDGRWKTQFESGTSYGAYYPEGRAAAELKGMGLPTSLPVQERPVYGFLRGAVEHDGSNGYGEVIFEMKPAVRERTTVTVRDSLGDFHAGNVIGSPFKKVSLASAGAYEYGSGGSIEPRRTVFGLKFNIRQDDEVGYFEAQIHGGLHLSDVAKATFGASCFEANGTLKDPYRYEAKALKELGVDVVLDPKTDSPADPLYVRYY